MTLIKKLIRIILSRTFVLSILVLLQLILITLFAYKIGTYGIYVYIIFMAISLIFSIGIMNRDFNPAYKISWLIFVLGIPFGGILFYALFGRLKTSKKTKEKFHKIELENFEFGKKRALDSQFSDSDLNKMVSLINNTTAMPIYNNTKTKLLTPGEKFAPDLIGELKNAQKNILFEFFVITEGRFFSEIYRVLKEKVKEGIDVRIIYDDFGCLKKMKKGFKKRLKKDGIKVATFNPLIPILNISINYRDHRKIIVIDGRIAYTGGMNISDEYINIEKPFGYWKDTMVKIEGEAVQTMTYLFFQMWGMCTKERVDYQEFLPKEKTNDVESSGYVQIFADGPVNKVLTTEMTYMQIINNAEKYVYITTPYLILDNEIISSLKKAAYSGIDVRIITPHIPDKKLVFLVTQSYYDELIKAGVKIYEFTPGFMHSKTIVSDDNVGIVGSANFDFRSLYLHFEISCVMYDSNTVFELKEDTLETISKSQLISFESCKNKSIFKKILVAILRAFSPML